MRHKRKRKLNIAYLNSHFSKKPDKIQKPKSKIGDKERLSKFNKKIFHKGYTLDCRNICCKFNRANNASDLKKSIIKRVKM